MTAVFIASCATVRPLPSALPADPAARLAAVRANEDRIRTLRARFGSVVHLPDSERSADGALVIAKPDRFRLRLLLPFGVTVFDYLNVGEQTWTVLPLAGDQTRERVAQFAPFSRDDLGQAFLRGPHAFPGSCEAAPAEPDRVLVSCRSGAELRRTVLIDTQGIAEEVSYEGGLARLVIRYDEYRSVDGTVLPFRIILEYPQRQQQVEIAIDGYEVNPRLSDDLFRPLEPSP